MVISKESLSDLKERYEKAQKLFEEESKLDPPSNPYRSAYEARVILEELKQNVKNLIDSSEEEDESQDRQVFECILGYIFKEVGRNLMATEEFTEAEKNLKKSIELVEKRKEVIAPETVILYVESLNEMGLFAIRKDAVESKSYLDRAEKCYNQFALSKLEPLTIYDIFGTKDEVEKGKGVLKLESNHTLTLFYQAQVCTMLEDLHNSAWYCHKTLKRQLQFNEYEPIDWSLNAALLSQYFFTHNKYHESRYHLSAATAMMKGFEAKMITDEMTDDQKEAAWETYNHRYADLMRCWAKYGLYVLSSSRDRLMEDDEVPKNALPDISTLKIYSEDLKFDSLDTVQYENQIIDHFCLTFDDAKPVFVKTLEWLNKAREYYNSETEATEYAKIVQDLSSLYNFLAFFEDDFSNQCKLHKKRADLIEDIIKVYNPQYYMNVCRESWYELGLIYSKMLDIKLDILDRQQTINDRPTPHALNKINLLCDKVINNFTAFHDSYRSKDTNEIPKTLDFDELQHILFCYFHIARIHYKKITPDRILQAKNINASLKYYNQFVSECEASKDAVAYFKNEMAVCREMITLLPKKLQILLDEIDTGH